MRGGKRMASFEQKLKAILSADKSQAELWEAMSWDQRRKVMQDIGLDDYAYDEALLQDGRYHELLGGMSDLYHDDFLARINGKTIKSKENGRKARPYKRDSFAERIMGRKFNYDMKSEKKKEEIKYIWYGLPYNLRMHAVEAFNILPKDQLNSMKDIPYDTLESKAAVAGTMSEFIDFILNHRQYSKSEKSKDAAEKKWNSMSDSEKVKVVRHFEKDVDWMAGFGVEELASELGYPDDKKDKVYNYILGKDKGYLKTAWDSLPHPVKDEIVYDSGMYEITAMDASMWPWSQISDHAKKSGTYNSLVSNITDAWHGAKKMENNKGALDDFWESQDMQMRQDLFLAAGFPPYDKRFTWPWSAIYDKFTYDEYQEIWHTVENYRMNLARYHGKNKIRDLSDEERDNLWESLPIEIKDQFVRALGIDAVIGDSGNHPYLYIESISNRRGVMNQLHGLLANAEMYFRKSRRKSMDDESFAKGDANPYSINNLERTWGLMPMTNRKYALPPDAQDKIDVSGKYWDVMADLEENNYDTDYMETSVMFQVGRFEPDPPLDYEKTKIDKYLEHKWEEMPRNLKEQMLAKYILQPDVYADADLYFLQNQMNGHKYYQFEDELFMKGNDRIYAALIEKAWNKKSPSDRRKALEYAGAGMDIVDESISKEYADLPRRAVETIKSFKPDRQWLQLTADEQDVVMNSMGLTEEQAAQVRAWDPDTWEKFPFSSNSDYYQGMDRVREMRNTTAPIDQFKRGTKLTRLGSTLTNPY